MMGSMMQDLAFAIPGVDEAMSFAEIMKCAVLPPPVRADCADTDPHGADTSSRWSTP